MVNAEIFLWGERIGAVTWNERYMTGVFRYDREFVKRGIEVSPIMMPLNDKLNYEFPNLSGQDNTFNGLPGLLADALPDAYGSAVLDQWLKTMHKSSINPIERLCYQGKRGMGALEFVPTYDDFLNHSGKIEMDSLVEVASEILSQRESFTTNFNDNQKEAIAKIISISTSAGGQRAKAVIAYNDKTQDIRSGQCEVPDGYGYWLIKLDGVTNKTLGDPEHYGEIEYVHYLMAKAAGINMTECRLLPENGRAHFMTRRFDRGAEGKIHMQSLCGMAHYDFKMKRAYSYEQAFGVMRRLHLPYTDAEEFYRRMVFNVVARNQDDHTKNISFLMNKNGEWRLSPAYDMSWSYNPKGDWTSMHQMSINDKWDNITREDLLKVAYEMNIKHAPTIIDKVVDAVSQWGQLAQEKTKIDPKVIDYIESTHVYL